MSLKNYLREESDKVKDLKSKSVLVYDYGSFLPLAQRLSRDFGKVYYYVPWKSGFPTSDKAMIGSNFPGVERIYDFWNYVDKADIIYFPDIYDSDIQRRLKLDGYKVFGSCEGEDLEINRWLFYTKLKEVGLPVIKTKKLKGIDNIREYLKNNDDKYLKASHFRGDMETWHHINYNHSLSWLDELVSKVGARQYIMELLVCDPIPSSAETGYDGWVVNGNFSDVGAIGYEVKDAAYIMKACKYKEMPKQVKIVNDKMAPVLKGLGYNGAHSTEIRVTENGTPYFIDPTMRQGYPPGCTMSELFDNFSEIVWDVAHGVLPKPRHTYDYGCEIILRSEHLKNNWLAVDFPKEIERRVKFKYATVIKGQYYCIPFDQMDGIGSVVGLGNSVEEAVENALEYANEVKGAYITYDEKAFEKAQESIERGEKLGMKF